ncbi:hypothetical protein SBP02_08520 [Pseudomonas benzenivorans]|uniref:EpsG family protein n=1 Tax=Pseudomonas benzenivorans TaxID=556533 RepID=A0ABZ0Q249_9PSED|nr:hypothetical protein [Pseudomonas benzenivorans]WPC06774.1 hypothetical protein SBP02_08520 [Pseudomonas benzenivorans]
MLTKNDVSPNPLQARAILRSCARALVVFFVFVGSLYIGPHYVLGDQVHYRGVYENLAKLSLVDGYIYYNSALDSLEFVHFLLSWSASRFLDKDLFIAIANALLAWVAFGVFQKWKASVLIAALLVLTNYYLIAMYFSAERLKFGFVFLGLSFLYIEKVKHFYVFSFIALVTHAQTLIVYFSLFFRVLFSQLSKVVSSGKISKMFLAVMVLLLVPVALMSGQLISKFNSYYDGLRGVSELARIFVFLILALYYARKKVEVLLVFIPLVFTVILVGGDRVNVLAYFVFLYYALPVNKGFNIGVLLTGLYFAFGSFEYVSNIFEYGKNRP